MYKIWILMMLIIGVFAQFRPINLNGPQITGNTFNSQRTTHQYVPPQSVGGGFQSSGGHVKMHETYHAPQSIGGGFQSRGGYVKMIETYHAPQSIGGGFQSQGGWTKVRDEPYVGPIAQTIIDIATFTASGHELDL